MSQANVLIIGDTHLPFEKKHYLDFCLETQKKYHCGQVVHIGDLVDSHALSYHEHDPNAESPADEVETAKRKIQEWGLAFPKVMLCKGNHDIMVMRKAITCGIPEIFFKTFRKAYGLPSGWDFEWEYHICNVVYQHGTGYSGKSAHVRVSLANRKSTVIGHCHSVSGIEYSANDIDLIFGMSVGCGIDRMQRPFWYGRDFKDKPIISCGVVIEGRIPTVVSMKI